MATLSTQNVSTAGTAITYSAAAAGGDRFVPSERTFLVVKNTSGGAITVTIATPGTVDTLAVADRTVSIPATNGERFIYVPDTIYRAADGFGDLTYSASAGLTVAVVTV